MNLANVLYYLREKAVENDLNLADKLLNIEPPEVAEDYIYNELDEGFQLMGKEFTKRYDINLFATREKIFYEDFVNGRKKFMQYTEANFLLKQYSIVSLEEWEVDTKSNIVLSENRIYEVKDKPYDWSEALN
jgi:hypothetical protein